MTNLKLQSDRILNRAAWRLIPFMSLMYVASFLDRVNISFAALTMNHDLGFSPQAYGFGAGIFFWGYFLFEVPSNLMLQKVGARLWMCRICVTWGLLSMLTAFVKDPVSFSIARFLLGAAEAGLYPGMLLYMTYWFPSSTRARFIALFLAGVPLSNVIGAPISGWLLGLSGHGLHGWQWMLILEGIPSLICGIAALWLLPEGPERAKWLSQDEKRIIAARLAAEPPGALHGFKEMLLDKRIWILMIPDFSIVIALYGLNLWQPQMIKAMGYSNIETGFIVALPYLLAMGAMVALGASSDRSGERAGHVAFGAVMGAVGMAGAVLLTNHMAVIVALCLACCGIYAALAVFWTLPASILRGTAAAGGLALLNSFSNLGGFFGPTLMGWAKQATGNYTLGMVLLSGMLVVAGGDGDRAGVLREIGDKLMRRLAVGYICLGILFAVPEASAVPVRYPSCTKSDASFKVFLQHFTNDVAFQRSRLSLPLVVRTGDGRTVSSTVEFWDLKHIQELKGPLIYSDAQRQKANISLSIDIVHESPAVAEAWQAEKSESDAVKLQYWFLKRDGCWFLAEFDDWSE